MSLKKPLTGKQEAAAVLVADDTLTDDVIAQQVGVTRRQLARWKLQDDFKASVQTYVDEAAHNLQRFAIARREKRVSAMNKRWLALHQVIEARGRDETMPDDVPGVDTGHIIRTLKGKDADVEEYVIDTGILAELRALEKQAAQEAGQWSDKTDVTTNGESLPGATVQVFHLPVKDSAPNPETE